MQAAAEHVIRDERRSTHTFEGEHLSLPTWPERRRLAYTPPSEGAVHPSLEGEGPSASWKPCSCSGSLTWLEGRLPGGAGGKREGREERIQGETRMRGRRGRGEEVGELTWGTQKRLLSSRRPRSSSAGPRPRWPAACETVRMLRAGVGCCCCSPV